MSYHSSMDEHFLEEAENKIHYKQDSIEANHFLLNIKSLNVKSIIHVS